MNSRTSRVLAYHERTKHGFDRFAASPGWLDWDNQPAPFRTWDGAPEVRLRYRSTAPELGFDAIYGADAPPFPVEVDPLGDVLRHAFGVSAWKSHGRSRWALRCNPSSGNLHPTEVWIVGTAAGGPAVLHYRPDVHRLSVRGRPSAEAWNELGVPGGSSLVALSSIAWREAWKYGERAFRYCQHDCGHAIAALSFSAALLGWSVRRLAWPDAATRTLLGLDREGAQRPGESEEVEWLGVVTPGAAAPRRPGAPDDDLLRRWREETGWQGRPNALSREHVSWPVIGEVAAATRSDGEADTAFDTATSAPALAVRRTAPARTMLRQRRSALAFDGTTPLSRDAFVRMLQRVLPGRHAPWLALGAAPRVHLALFVHRVEGVEPGLHLLCRSTEARARLEAALRETFKWAPVPDTPTSLPLHLLAAGDCTELAASLSCGQDIAGDGCFSLGIIAELERALVEHGPQAYRELYWECGTIGQVLYLEAEAAGLRATGIGCFHDDPVHEALGLRGSAFQSLYHFTVGNPVEDSRLTTHPAYPDEQ